MLSYLNPLPKIPQYTGDHGVGSTEFEISLSSFSIDVPTPDSSLKTIKFRAFYPTAVTSAREPIYWLPQPQSKNIQAYLKIANLNPWLQTVLANVPLYLRTAVIPAVHNAPLLPSSTPYPVLIFSHGLMGGMNTHSGFLGELASRGVVCIAIEHRDGSSPISMVRSGNSKDAAVNEINSVPFRRITFFPKDGVYDLRDAQLQIRLFELSATYEVLRLFNAGIHLPNIASEMSSAKDSSALFPASSLDLSPGSVSWAGHSFGGSTLVQFIKSVFYSRESNIRQDGESTKGSLLMGPPTSHLLAQIRPSSPLLLFDPWAMPLRSPSLAWLLAKPLPCYSATGPSAVPTTITIISSELQLYWPEIHAHIPKIMSANPTLVRDQTREEYDAEMKIYPTRQQYLAGKRAEHATAQKKKLTKSQISRKTTDAPAAENMDEKIIIANGNATSPDSNPRSSSTPPTTPSGTAEMEAVTYVIADTCHVTESDFGLLFPWVSWWFSGQKEPARATAVMVEAAMALVKKDGSAAAQMDRGDGYCTRVAMAA